MKQTILSVVAIGAAIALAGCGASTNASGGAGGVAGVHHTKAAGNFSASVHGFEARLQTSVSAFRHGNVAAAAASAGSLLSSCTSTVNDKLAPRAATATQMKAVIHLRVACSDMSKATNAGMSGNLTKAQQLAKSALQQSQIAARLSG